MMVTVAKSLDVPIKLMFPRPPAADDPSGAPSHAMLGLGDVVLPGIMIGLALRFDLYLFYLRREKRTPAPTEGEEDVIEKPQYHSLAGRWSDHFWTHSLTGRPLWIADTAKASKPEAPFTFPKTYFTAGLVGYVLGLLATLGVMMVWNHAQPALLYLVPGVLSSLWLTAFVRGELKLMWDYTEDIGDEQGRDKKKSDDKEMSAEEANGVVAPESSTAEDSDKETDDVQRAARHCAEREVFSFSIEAPWKLKHPRSVGKDISKEKYTTGTGKPNWAPAKLVPDTEPAGKRVRLK